MVPIIHGPHVTFQEDQKHAQEDQMLHSAIAECHLSDIFQDVEEYAALYYIRVTIN